MDLCVGGGGTGRLGRRSGLMQNGIDGSRNINTKLQSTPDENEEGESSISTKWEIGPKRSSFGS